MSKMRAAVLSSNENINVELIDKPTPKPGEVLVRVHACGICGSDVPRVLHNGAHNYPIVLGHEFSGEIVELGEGVVDRVVGQKVAGAPLVPCMKCDACAVGDYALCKHYSFIGSRRQGAFAEYVAIPAFCAVPFDDSIPYEIGALFEPSTVALHGLLLAGFRGGESVAVLGCGTIGIFALQWARILGASSITAFDVDDARLSLAKRMGASHVVNTTREGFLDAANDISQGGFAYVFETAGAHATMHMAYKLAVNKASVCFIGTPHKDITFDWKLWELMNRKEFRLTGSWMSYSAPFPGKEWTWTAREFGTGRLVFDESIIYKKMPLEKISDAFQLYKTPGVVSGRILIET